MEATKFYNGLLYPLKHFLDHFHWVTIVVKVLYKLCWLSMELHKNNSILETSMLLCLT